MTQGLGMVLIAAGCAWSGFRAAAGFRDRVRGLEQMTAGLKLLQQELELEGPALPQLMARLSGRTAGPAKQLFSGCRHGLERLDREAFSHLWRRLVEERRELGPEAQSALLPLGETLGRCDCPAQCRAVEGVCRRLEQLQAEAELAGRRQGTVCRALGVSGGIFLIILLL